MPHRGVTAIWVCVLINEPGGLVHVLGSPFDLPSGSLEVERPVFVDLFGGLGNGTRGLRLDAP